MEIKLKTNSDDRYLTFKNIERFSDNSGYGTTLIVRSRGFSAEIIFTFELHPMDTFIKELEEMNQKFTGSATLKPRYEEHFIEFKITSLGHIIVSGTLIEYSDQPQKLEFEFKTDQTILAPLIEDLKKWQNMKTS